MSFTTPFFLFIFFPLSVALYYGAAALETWIADYLRKAGQVGKGEKGD